MGKKTISIYADGGVYSSENRLKYAFIVVKDDKITHAFQGEGSCSGFHTADVEKAESLAIFYAVKYVKEHPANYILITDSRQSERKIREACVDATRNPVWEYVRKALQYFKSSPKPISLTVKWQRRRSDKWSEIVDDLCGEKILC
jgi:ribonuclease HI